jgi:hypothetical protein
LSNNVAIITRFEHAFRAGDQATIDELCDPGLVDHNPAPDHEPTLAGFKQKVAGFFPDLEEELQDIIASGDTVVNVHDAPETRIPEKPRRGHGHTRTHRAQLKG